MAWDHRYDVNTPAGTDDPKEGDDRIREVKAALQERIAKDHYFPKTGSEVSDEDAGEHKKVTLRTGDAPTKADDKGHIYAKDVSDKAELFYIDEDGNEVQITTGGLVKSLAPKIHSAVGSTNISTTSVSLVDMANASITATFPAGKVLINFNCTLRIAGDDLSIIAIDVDGTKIKTSAYVNAPYIAHHSISIRWVETLTAGEHTIKIQWSTAAYSTLYQDGATYKRILTILECR